ncbi:MAG: MobC family plasmid mobilization relaxosome protein [Acetobacteraceae bacterium]
MFPLRGNWLSGISRANFFVVVSADPSAARPPRRPRRGGRPPLSPGEQRRCHLSIALTAAERALLDERAALAGLRPAVYLRQAALAGAAAVDRRVDLMRLHVELRRIGNNLNQIAHAANSALAGDEYPAVRAAVASIEGALGDLRAALAAIRSSLP